MRKYDKIVMVNKMKETIGAKGGSSDRKRSFRIRKKRKEKELENEEIRELEERVRKQQRKTLFLVVPLIIFGTIAKTLSPFKTEKKVEKNNTAGKKKNKKPQVESNEIQIEKSNIKTENVSEKEIVPEKKEYVWKKKEEKIIPEEERIILEEKLEKEITKAKSNKIVEEYESKLKEIRRKIRNNYFESDILDDIKDIENDPSEKNLEKLNELIEKIESLKEKTKQEEKIEIEEDYLSVLVEEDLEELKYHREVKGIPNPEILYSISDKIVELKEVEEKQEEKVEAKKQFIEPEIVEERKEKAHDMTSFQNDFVKLQNEQDEILKEIQTTIKKDIPPMKKMKVEINGMQMSSAIVLRRIRKQMRIPGVRSGRKIVNLATSFLYYNSLLHSVKPRKVRYKNIEIKDYSKEIEKNISDMDNVLSQISKTTNQIELVIKQLQERYGEYQDTKEFQKLLDNLNKMKKALEEKEFEIKKLKLEQEKRLEREKNPAKVYKR